MAGRQPAYDVADLSLAEQGAARAGWAERSMPVLATIRERFATRRPLAGARVVACLHVTSETAALLRTLQIGGAQVRLAASNPLSTQDDTAAALVRDGVGVFARRGIDIDGYYAHIDAALAAGTDIVLDDGCDLVNRLHTARPDLLDRVRGGCEETTTGVIRLRRMAAAGVLRFPVVAVNDTATRQLLDNTHGTGQSTLDALLRATNLLLAGRSIVVAGYGYCGKGVAARARGLGAHVVVTEIDPTKALDATLAGFRVLPMAAAARLADVVVTVTGNCGVLRTAHFAVMKDGAVLVNAGHFDVEIDVPALAALAVAVHRDVRPGVDEYVLADGRRLLLLAQGRVANLAVAEGNPAAVMDMGFAGQALCVEWLLTASAPTEPGVYAVPPGIDEQVARLGLAAMGVAIDELAPEQQAYLGSWERGS